MLLSVYCKYVFVALFIGTLARSLAKSRSTAFDARRSQLFTLLAALCFSALSVLYFTGTAGTPYGIARLALPFSHGHYLVFQGGKGLPTNVFHFSGRHTFYAMDIVRLNKFGNRANHIFSKRLADYAIFGDTIYSPCSGIVKSAQDGNPDNIPPVRKRGPTNLNHVLIQSPSTYVFLGHLQHHAVFVKEGDHVSTGQPLGLVGNSGMSIEPHLHIQAHANTHNGLPWYREPQLLIMFNDKNYLLFEEIDAP